MGSVIIPPTVSTKSIFENISDHLYLSHTNGDLGNIDDQDVLDLISYIDVNNGSINEFLCTSTESIYERTQLSQQSSGGGSADPEEIVVNIGGIRIGPQGHINIPFYPNYITHQIPEIILGEWAPNYTEFFGQFGHIPYYYFIDSYRVYGGKLTGKLLAGIRNSKFYSAEILADAIHYIEDSNFDQFGPETYSPAEFYNTNVNIGSLHMNCMGRVGRIIPTLFKIALNSNFVTTNININGISEDELSSGSIYNQDALFMLEQNGTFTNLRYMSIKFPVNSQSLLYRFKIFNANESTINLANVNVRRLSSFVYANESTINIIQPMNSWFDDDYEIYDDYWYGDGGDYYGDNYAFLVLQHMSGDSAYYGGGAFQLYSCDLNIKSDFSTVFHSTDAVANNMYNCRIFSGENNNISIKILDNFRVYGNYANIAFLEYSSLYIDNISLTGYIDNYAFEFYYSCNVKIENYELYECVLNSGFVSGQYNCIISVMSNGYDQYYNNIKLKYFVAFNNTIIYSDNINIYGNGNIGNSYDYGFLHADYNSTIEVGDININSQMVMNETGTIPYFIFSSKKSSVKTGRITFSPTITGDAIINYFMWAANAEIRFALITATMRRAITPFYCNAYGKIIQTSENSSYLSTITGNCVRFMQCSDNSEISFNDQLTFNNTIFNTAGAKILLGPILAMNSSKINLNGLLTMNIQMYQCASSFELILIHTNSEFNNKGIVIVNTNHASNTNYSFRHIIHAYHNSIINSAGNISIAGPTSGNHTFDEGIVIESNSRMNALVYTTSYIITPKGIRATMHSEALFNGAVTLYSAVTNSAYAELASRICAISIPNTTSPAKTSPSGSSITYGNGASYIMAA